MCSIMLITKDVTFAYNEQTTFRFPDIQCRQGEQWLILGQSGSGKTTLLHLLGGLLRTYSGSIKVENQELSALSETALDRFRGQHIGIIFQQSHLLRSLTVEQNILTAQYLAGRKQDRAKVQALLDRLGLGHKRDSYTNRLSLGEQQRVAIARALINDPQLILADEPTSSLDDKNCTEAANLLLEQSRALNAALLIVTHDSRLKELISHQVVVHK